MSGEAATDEGGGRGGRGGRGDRWRARVTGLAERGQARATAARSRWSAVDAAFATWDRDRRVVGSVLAGAIAFRLFVYLLPLMLAVVTVLGIAVGIEDGTPDEIGERLGLSRYVVDSVATASRDSHRSLWILVPITLWAVYSGGVGAARVLHAVHALAWDQPVRRLGHSWLAALAAFGTALVATVAVAGLQAMREASEGLGVGFVVVEVGILVGVALLLARALPHDPAAGWVDLLPGSVLVGVGFWALHVVSAYVLAYRIASASDLYGSLGVAAALLAWLFVLGRLLVGSAILNSTLWERHHPPRPPRPGEDGPLGPDGSSPPCHAQPTPPWARSR